VLGDRAQWSTRFDVFARRWSCCWSSRNLRKGSTKTLCAGSRKATAHDRGLRRGGAHRGRDRVFAHAPADSPPVYPAGPDRRFFAADERGWPGINLSVPPIAVLRATVWRVTAADLGRNDLQNIPPQSAGAVCIRGAGLEYLQARAWQSVASTAPTRFGA
jgi:hypothetical protein